MVGYPPAIFKKRLFNDIYPKILNANRVIHLFKSIRTLNDAIIHFREVTNTDLLALAHLRSRSEDQIPYWQDRITNYLNRTHTPQKALPERIIYIAEYGERIVGFIAGQLTTRFGCQGEVQWLDVDSQFRRRRIGSILIKVLAEWFTKNNVYRICVDPGTDLARRFYESNGASKLNEHWMFWEDIRIVLRK